MSLEEEREAEDAVASDASRSSESGRSGGVLQFALKAVILAVIVSVSAIFVVELDHRQCSRCAWKYDRPAILDQGRAGARSCGGPREPIAA